MLSFTVLILFCHSVLTGSARYDYTHELLPSLSTFYSHNFGEVEVGRERRISVIFRDSKGPNN